MKRFVVLMIAMLMIGNLVLAEGENEKCVLEDWRSYEPMGGWLTFEGTTTCKNGWIYIRVYQSGEYKGNAEGMIEYYTFTAIGHDMKLNNEPIEIKYGVEAD